MASLTPGPWSRVPSPSDEKAEQEVFRVRDRRRLTLDRHLYYSFNLEKQEAAVQQRPTPPDIAARIEREVVGDKRKQQIARVMSASWNNPATWGGDGAWVGRAEEHAKASGGVAALRLYLLGLPEGYLATLRARTPSLLHAACTPRPFGNLAAVVLLAAEFKFPLSSSPPSRVVGNPLHMACRRGCCNIVEYLLTFDDCGLNACIPCTGNTPAHEAAEGGHTEVLLLLAREGAVLTRKNLKGRTPLLSACHEARVAATEALLERFGKMFDINATDTEGMTAVAHAVVRGSPALVRLLLSKGASVTPSSPLYWTPLQLACRLDDHAAAVTLARLLLSNSPSPVVASQAASAATHPASLAAKRNNKELLRLLEEEFELRRPEPVASFTPSKQ